MELPHGLIISCQAVEGEPLYGLGYMPQLARAAVLGGAQGIRANTTEDIDAIKALTGVPVIGIIKRVYEDSNVYITPTLEELSALCSSSADVIALDATLRYRHGGITLTELVSYARKEAPQKRLMADCATAAEAENAVRLGFDYIGTTLRGYTEETKGIAIPDIAFLKELKERFPNKKLIAEGGIWEKAQLIEVWETGVYAVVIGSAVTRPKDITSRFAEVLNEYN